MNCLGDSVRKKLLKISILSIPFEILSLLYQKGDFGTLTK